MRKAKSRTADMKKEKVLLAMHEQMGEQDNELNILTKGEKISFALHGILVIYFLVIMIIKICLRHQKVMKKYHPCL